MKITTIAVTDSTKKRLIKFAVYGQSLDNALNKVIDIAEKMNVSARNTDKKTPRAKGGQPT